MKLSGKEYDTILEALSQYAQTLDPEKDKKILKRIEQAESAIVLIGTY